MAYTTNYFRLKKEHWRKSANWFGLTRKHAFVFHNVTQYDQAFEGVICVDEHFLPTILATYGLDNETTCTDGMSHVNWPNQLAMHPKTYSPNEINAELFAYFERPVGDHPGFSMQCSGFEELCHFTARKFSGRFEFSTLVRMVTGNIIPCK